MKRNSLVMVLVVVMFFTSCNTPPRHTQDTPTYSQEVIPSATTIPTQPAVPKPTMSFASTPQPEATLTYDYEQSQNRIAAYLKTNDHCAEACFWGIVPEMTSIKQASDLLSSLQGKPLEWSDYHYTSNQKLDNKHISIQIEIWVDADNIVNSLEASMTN